jgi:DNA invertase Pin-like site-specific DNA recombinase
MKASRDPPAKRPALLRCLKALNDGDTLTVWKLDLVGMLDDFNSHRIQFQSLTEEINTTTPGGK